MIVFFIILFVSCLGFFLVWDWKLFFFLGDNWCSFLGFDLFFMVIVIILICILCNLFVIGINVFLFLVVLLLVIIINILCCLGILLLNKFFVFFRVVVKLDLLFLCWIILIKFFNCLLFLNFFVSWIWDIVVLLYIINL